MWGKTGIARIRQHTEKKQYPERLGRNAGFACDFVRRRNSRLAEFDRGGIAQLFARKFWVQGRDVGVSHANRQRKQYKMSKQQIKTSSFQKSWVVAKHALTDRFSCDARAAAADPPAAAADAVADATAAALAETVAGGDGNRADKAALLELVRKAAAAGAATGADEDAVDVAAATAAADVGELSWMSVGASASFSGAW